MGSPARSGPEPPLWGSQPWMPPGDDRVLGDAVPFQQVYVDALPEVFRSQLPVRSVERAVLHGGLGEHAERHAQGVFRVPGRLRDGGHLVFGLHRPLVPEGILLRRHLEPSIPQLVGVAQGEGVRHEDAFHLPVAEQLGNGVHESGVRGAAALRAVRVVRERYDFIDLRLGARAVDFQVAHHDGRPAVHPQEGEGVRHEQPRGVQHVGVAFAVRDEQDGLVTG